MRTLKHFMLIMMLATLLVSIPAALAQEEAMAETDVAVPGITAGVLLIGLVGVIFVGGALIVRDSFSPEGESE